MIRLITAEHRNHMYDSRSSDLARVTETVWDACVIGSGPGGAVSAATAVRDFATGRIVARPQIRARIFVLAAGAFFSAALLSRTPALVRSRAGRKI
jgi:hypothetical protein